MKDAFDDWSDEVLHMREQHAAEIAAGQIKRYAMFSRMPVKDAAGALVIGYERKLSVVGLSEAEADILLKNDIHAAIAAIRLKTFGLPKLSEPRLAVVAHLALLLGAPLVQTLTEFWRALRAEDYEAAADEMLLSVWPRLIGNEARDKQRALDLVFMMRTGNVRPPRANEGSTVQ